MNQEATANEKLDRILIKIVNVETRLEQTATSQQFNTILNKLLDMDARLDQTVSNQKFDEFRDKVFTILDQQSAILQRLDQERVFTYEWIKRIENDLAEKEREIKNIKQVLNIS